MESVKNRNIDNLEKWHFELTENACNVRILPYKDITFDIAKLEGEDDTLESWRNNHEVFFREEGKELGYEFTEDMEVIFEEFEVVEILQ
ncbi:MAG: ASCH domain-containing protein [Acetatifactor sp.]